MNDLIESRKLARAMAKVFKGHPEYNPDQPRDETGRWSGGGGSSGSDDARRAKGLVQDLRNGIKTVRYELSHGYQSDAEVGAHMMRQQMRELRTKYPKTFAQLKADRKFMRDWADIQAEVG